MKLSKPPRLLPSDVSMKAWKAPVWPCGIADEESGAPRTPIFAYSETEDILLPVDYKPTKYDVINGRGKKSYNHIANRRFRQLTAMNLKRYQNCKCKVDKTLIVIGIVNAIRRSSPMGGFIKKDRETGRWISMSDEGAREKVGHCLRDMNASQREEKKKATRDNEVDASRNHQALAAYVSDIPKSFSPRIPKTFNTQPNSHPRIPASTKRTSFVSPTNATAPSASDAQLQKQTHIPPYDYPSTVHMPSTAAAMMVPHMNPFLMGHSGFFPATPAHRFHPDTMAGMQNVSSSFNKFGEPAMRWNTTQEMSLQQQKILKLLEKGFKGSVEEILNAVR